MWIFNLLKRIVYLTWYRLYYIPSHKSLFDPLKQIRRIHEGERVFIIATGPSLNERDLDMLKNEITFGMNSIYKMFDKTDWRPTYYCVADGGVYQKIKADIDNNISEIEKCFCNDKIPWNNDKVQKIPVIQNLCNNETLRNKLHYFSQKSHTSNNIVNGIFMGNSVVHVITQICFYMGFKEIYYLGADCSNFNKHASGCEHNLINNRKEENLARGIKADYISDYEYAKSHGILMFNATRGGELEVFPRVTLENVLRIKN